MSTNAEGWRGVDVGWGREAVRFATWSEPANCREYVAVHQRLGIGSGDRVLDVACGAGLAMELASVRGADCAGIDASARLVAVARDRVPTADVRVGDMADLPWDDGAFDAVTSFRGIWGTTPEAVVEVLRVLTPGGRLGITVWGHIKASPGAWALTPFSWAAEPKVRNQSAMVSLGRPGAGEQLLEGAGFVDVERIVVPFAWEFADPESYALALASTGPAYEAIQAIGEPAFLERAAELAWERVRSGLPLRAEIDVVGYLARAPRPSGPPHGFLATADPTPEAQALYDDDVDELGYVMNASRVWGHDPGAQDALFALLGRAVRTANLSLRQRGVLVAACASTLGDSYCALAWGSKLAKEAGDHVAAEVLTGTDDGLDETERALAVWARRVTGDANGIGADDIEPLRAAGFTDAQILAITYFVALRIAFSTVNDALGARPDAQLVADAPEPVRRSVRFGRRPATSS